MIRQESLSILGGSITSELWHQSQEAPEDLIILRQGESVPMTLFSKGGRQYEEGIFYKLE